MNYGMTKPCDNCPFRSDKPFPLARGRVSNIERGLFRGEFACHKTTAFDDDGEYVERDDEQHCAGALILMEKLGRSSQMMRVCERLGLYDARKLDMTAPVYETFQQMEERCEA